MARLRVVILEQFDARSFQYLLWADVPADRQSFYARSGATSAWKDATASDNTALALGRIAEQVDHIVFPPGVTLTQAQAALQAQWQSFQDGVTASNRWSRYGTAWDGLAWVNAGAA